MAATTGTLAGGPGIGRTRRVVLPQPGRVDRIFDRVTLIAGLTVLFILALVGAFLLYQSRHAFAEEGWSFFTRSAWRTSTYPPQIGVLGLLFGTVVVAAIAEVIAVPLGVVVGLYIAEYAPAHVAQVPAGDDRPAGGHPQHPVRPLGVLLPQLPDRAAVPMDDHTPRLDPHLPTRIPAPRWSTRSSSPASWCRSWSSPSWRRSPGPCSPRRPPGRRRRLWPWEGPDGAWSARSSCPTAGAGSSAGRCSAWAEHWGRPSPSPSCCPRCR